MGATRLALAERLRDQTTVLEGSMICCSPLLAPGSAGQQAGFRMQHYEPIGALAPSALVPSTALRCCLRGSAHCITCTGIIIIAAALSESRTHRPRRRLQPPLL